jgi:hypothetical protein
LAEVCAHRVIDAAAKNNHVMLARNCAHRVIDALPRIII